MNGDGSSQNKSVALITGITGQVSNCYIAHIVL